MYEYPPASRSRDGDASAQLQQPAPARLQLWGGAECTVNRVGDVYRDQLIETGHDSRICDLDLIAGLGIKKLRMPILWERTERDHDGKRHWHWSDERIARLRDLGIEPIAGLVHHGSGPRYTSLLDDQFPVKLAAYALDVAQRYPHIRDWTPVNEPVTTARFSALYGHWYPHVQDEASFWRALVNQIDGVRLSMQAIRGVNPHARLIQTDDLGRTYAAEPLERQARYNNARRWAGWDMLCGRLTEGHPLWDRLVRFGLEKRLNMLADKACPPDMIGINHYLTSDRFLDHRVGRYPVHTHGGNAKMAYADVEAVRVLDPAPDGLAVALREAWNRYAIPIAITEVHLGCTREEQVRWLRSAWNTAEKLHNDGVDVQAVTAWALFGNQGWNTLLTERGIYEPGVFDVTSGSPRRTALANTICDIENAIDIHPAVGAAGWWQRDIRCEHEKVPHRCHFAHGLVTSNRADESETRPIVILGATGTLGRALVSACEHRNLAAVATSRAELDLGNETAMAAALDRLQPAAVINAAGWVRVDDAEEQCDACYEANASGAAMLARLCDERGIATVSFSSDLVFGDDANVPRVESDATAPLNVYGDSKARMEEAVLGLGGDHLIVRTAAFFSPFDPHNFAVHAFTSLNEGRPFAAAQDQVVTPTYVPHLCNATLDLLIDGETGFWHLSNGEAVSWAEFARRLAEACDLDPELVLPVAGRDIGWRAVRPQNCALASERGSPMPSLDLAIERFAHAMCGGALLQRRDNLACAS